MSSQSPSKGEPQPKLTGTVTDAGLFTEEVIKEFMDGSRSYHHPKGGWIELIWDHREPGGIITSKVRKIAVSSGRARQEMKGLSDA